METNELYPVFLKVNELNILIVGGGNVGLEKLTFFLNPVLALMLKLFQKHSFRTLVQLANKHKSVKLTTKTYDVSDLSNRHIVIGCTDSKSTNLKINQDAKKRHLLVNIADTPDQCDFYMGGIVTKGNVKIAISTNGKSPTTAKRIRQFLEDIIPEDINKLVLNLNSFRKKIKGDFEEKVERLNEVTKGLLDD